MRLVFLGAPPFATAVFERLLASRHDVALLITPPDRRSGRGRHVQGSALVELAAAHGIAVYQPANSREEGFSARLRAAKPEVMMVASYGEILRADVLDVAPALNVHASLLPRWRGASPIQYAIRAGDEVTGVSVQRIVLALDAGDVLLRKQLTIADGETAAELLTRLSELGAAAAVEALDALEDGTAQFEPQDPEGVTIAKKLTKDDGLIDWQLGAVELERLIRSVTPWPGARTFLPNGKALTVERAHVRDTNQTEGDTRPGSILAATKSFVVACGQGALELECVRPEGRASMAGAAFLRGARLTSDSRLGS